MPRFFKHTRQKRHGIVFILALITMLAMMITGVGFLGMATLQYRNAQHDAAAVKALSLAVSGVNYAIWNQNNSGKPDLNVPSSLPDKPRNLNAGTQNFWGKNDTFDGGKYKVWMASYNAAGTANGYEVVAVGTYGGYSRALRVVFESTYSKSSTDPGSSTGGTDPSSTSGDLRFDHTLLTDSDLTFDGNCAIGGNTAVNGDLNVTGSGRFVKTSDGNGGNVNVSGDLTMTGNSSIEGVANVHGNADFPGGSPKISGALNALGSLDGNYNGTVNNATVNGNVNLTGLGLTGFLKTAGNFRNSGHNRQVPSNVFYAGTYTNTGITDYNGISQKATVTPLPATTGAAINMEEHRVNIDAWQPTTFTKTLVGNYTVKNGSPQFTDSDVHIKETKQGANDVNWNFSGGPNIMNFPPNAHILVDGNLTSTCNTTFNATDMVLYVKGDINIGGSFKFNGTGKIVIVAEGQLSITGGYDFGNTNVVLLSKTGIKLTGNPRPINATMYVHSDTNTGLLYLDSVPVHGSAICDKAIIRGSGQLMDYTPPPFNLDPSGGSTGGSSGGGNSTNPAANSTWVLASWEVLY